VGAGPGVGRVVGVGLGSEPAVAARPASGRVVGAGLGLGLAVGAGLTGLTELAGLARLERRGSGVGARPAGAGGLGRVVG
jgi:hypothetical protein